MGNQLGSDQVSKNKNLSQEEFHSVLQIFKDGKIKRLPNSWDIFDEAARLKLEQYLRDKDGTLIPQRYADLAGDTLKGGLEDKARFLILLSGGEQKADSLTLKHLLDVLQKIGHAFNQLNNTPTHHSSDIINLAQSLVHDLAFPGQKRKATIDKEFDGTISIDSGDIENLLNYNPIVEFLMSHTLTRSFNLSPPSRLPLRGAVKESFMSALPLYFLNYHLPHKLRDVWRPLFLMRRDGESFAKFSGSISNQGPTLICIKDNEGNVYGGFASHSWRLGPKFFGDSDSFLFQVRPRMHVYDSTPFNQNFQYFNNKQQTMPNGLGQGGQLDYFGYWIDSEFGLVSTAPSCSTFHSPQLGAQNGRIAELEVWGVGPEAEQEEGKRSVLNMDPELQAVMEMMGKTFHSKAIREVDDKEEEEERIEQLHGQKEDNN